MARKKSILPPCNYAAHRGSDWRYKDGKVAICGICHPPPLGPHLKETDIVRRADAQKEKKA